MNSRDDSFEALAALLARLRLANFDLHKRAVAAARAAVARVVLAEAERRVGTRPVEVDFGAPDSGRKAGRRALHRGDFRQNRGQWNRAVSRPLRGTPVGRAALAKDAGDDL
jgi:hypothetical protein